MNRPGWRKIGTFFPVNERLRCGLPPAGSSMLRPLTTILVLISLNKSEGLKWTRRAVAQLELPGGFFARHFELGQKAALDEGEFTKSRLG